MPQLKIGIAASALRQPLRRAIASAQRLGASAVELEARNELRPSEVTDTALRQIKKLLDDANLKVCSLSFMTRRGYNDLDALDRRVAATKEAMQLAYKLRAPVVVNSIGRVPQEAGEGDWDLFLETLGDLGHFADRAGASLAARTGSEEGAALARLLAALPAGGVGVDFDPAALLVNGYSAIDALAHLGPYVRQVRARDGVRDLAAGRGQETQLGRGSADFPALIGALEDFAYRGYFTIDRQHSADPQSDIANAVQFLRNM